MIDALKLLLGFFAVYKVWGLVLILIVLITILSFKWIYASLDRWQQDGKDNFLIRHLFNRDTIKPKKKKLEKKDNTESSMHFENHLFFSKVKFLESSTIPLIPIADPGRKELFKDLLFYKVGSLRDQMSSFISIHKDTIDEMEEHEFGSKMLESFGNSLCDFERRCKFAQKDPIPVVVYDVFNKWHKQMIDFTQEYISHTVVSSFFTSNSDKLNAILELYSIIANKVVTDGYIAFNELNGELDNLYYKGLIIAPKDVPKKPIIKYDLGNISTDKDK